MHSLETRAAAQFGLPPRAPKSYRDAYMAYLREALTTLCPPDVWPPMSYAEWRENYTKENS